MMSFWECEVCTAASHCSFSFASAHKKYLKQQITFNQSRKLLTNINITLQIMISNMTAHITVTVLIQFIFVVSIILSVIPAAKHHF
jgi:hypothetical protein